MTMIAAVSQKEQILSYLHTIDQKTGKRRGLSPLEAIGLFRIYRLAARIEELRRAGHDIRSEIKRDTTGKVYCRYFLDR